MIKRYTVLFFFICSFINILQSHAIALYTGLAAQKREEIILEQLESSRYSFHFLLTTIGRRSILNILQSLEKQVQKQDYLTIVFDAQDIDNVLEKVKEYTAQFKCTVTIIVEEKNLGYWGHGIRNKYAYGLPGDFILHCDDDNAYIANAIAVVRKICQNPAVLYLFKIRISESRFVWKEPKIYYSNIDTACGVIPAQYNHLGRWEYFHGGDAAFYKGISTKIDPQNIVFVDFPIYQWRP